MATKKDPKPKILKIVRTDSYVEITHELAKSSEHKADPQPGDKAGDQPKTKLVTSSSTFKEKAHEAPLPSFDDALQALGAVAAKVMDCDSSWAGKGGKGKLEVGGLAISYTENGTRSATLSFTKSLLDGTIIHKMSTPSFRIDDDKSGKTGRREVTPKHAELVIDMIKEAQKYAAGDRSQELLDFKTDEDSDDDKIEQLPGMAGSPTTRDAAND